MLKYCTALVCLVVALWIAPSVQALTPICLDIPSDSPILAPNVDDIPPGAETILTYTGARAAIRANGDVTMVEIDANQQQFWFGPDASVGSGYIYYNRRYRANTSSPWYWQYSQSIPIIGIGNGSAAPQAILYSATPKYRDTYHYTQPYPLYKYVAYTVDQPRSCNGSVAGILKVSFSNNGVCWTEMQPVHHPGGPTFACDPSIDEAVAVESVAAFDDGTKVYIMGIEGDISILAQRAQMDSTQVYVGWFSYTNLGTLTLFDPDYAATSNGIVSPPGLAGSQRYKPYNYLMNVDATYDPATGYVYVSRAYPYPFDRGALESEYPYYTTPCVWQAEVVQMWDSVYQEYSSVQGAGAAPATLPNRIQIYKMYIGPLSNLPSIAYPTAQWTLVRDLGGAVGYSNSFLTLTCPTTNTTPLSDVRQLNAGRDYAYANFIRTANGNAVNYGDGVLHILAGDSVMLTKGSGYARITGLERETLITVPR